MTIETTKASRGRSMKMPEIMVAQPRARVRARRQQDRRPARPGPGRTFWMPSTITCSPSLHARGDDDVGAALRAGLHAALLDLVLVVDDQHVVAGLVDLQRRLRHHQPRLFLAFADDGRHELAVGQGALGIGHGRPHDQRVGLLVDLRIGEVPDAALRIFLAVRAGGRGCRSWPGRRPPCAAPRGSSRGRARSPGTAHRSDPG